MALDNRKQHGFISWGELYTTNTDTAKEFYKKLFGWKYENCKSSSGGEYIVASKEKDAIAGMMNLKDLPINKGVPPHWGMYITVDCIDTALEQAKAEGGSIVMEKTALDSDSYFAFISDPQGATLGLLQCTFEE